MDYRGYTAERREKALLFCALGVGLLSGGILFFDTWLFLLLLPALTSPAVKAYCSYRAEGQRNLLLLQFRDLLYELSSAFSSGMHMEEALAESRKKLTGIYGEKELILTEIGGMLRKMEAGETELQVWEDFAGRSDLADIRSFAEVFRVCRETGGDFISAIDKAAKLIGEKIMIEQEIRAMMAQKKAEGLLITVMPFLLILFLRIASPGYLDPLYHTVAGRLLMLLVLGLIGLAGKLIEGMVKIEI